MDAPTGKRGLRYNGQEQQLLETGARSDTGTVEYSLDGAKYDTALPKAAKAGEDYVAEGLFGNDRLLTPPTLKCFSQSGSELRPGQTLLSTAVIRADGADAGKNYTIRYVDGTLTAEDQPVNSHPVVVKTSTHGTVTALPIRTSKGTTVTLTAKPESGYTLETLTVTDGAGNVLTLTDKGERKLRIHHAGQHGDGHGNVYGRQRRFEFLL